jgi:hypothetical protein
MSGPARPKAAGPQLSGVVGFYDDPHELVEAMRKVRDANYQYYDAFTPYPVHGLEAAQGLKRSPLPYVTFGAGLTGGTLGFLLQYWTSAVDWPLNVGGKPFNSWPAFVPVTFELCVLLAALSTVGAMFLFNGLPNTRRRVVDPSVTRDRFALMIEAPPQIDPEDDRALAKAAKFKAFDPSEATQFLSKLGAKEVRTIYAEGWF